MLSCWQENPDNRPTFETLYMRFDEFMIQAEPNYREVIDFYVNLFSNSIDLDMNYLRIDNLHYLFSDCSQIHLRPIAFLILPFLIELILWFLT